MEGCVRKGIRRINRLTSCFAECSGIGAKATVHKSEQFIAPKYLVFYPCVILVLSSMH